MNRFLFPILLTGTLVLTACSASATPPQIPAEPTPSLGTMPASTKTVQLVTNPTPTDDPSILATPFPNMGGDSSLSQIDTQGMIVVEVTPLNLDNTGGMLEFEVAMNTHSVDLGMDLADLGTLTTDTGVVVQAVLWDAPRGGHHVEGTLQFPAIKDGTPVLEGAKQIIINLRDIDAPMRTFTWQLP